jgi:hypothetical protein
MSGWRERQTPWRQQGQSARGTHRQSHRHTVKQAHLSRRRKIKILNWLLRRDIRWIDKTVDISMRFEVLRAVRMKMFSVVTPCTLIGRYQRVSPEDGDTMLLQNVGTYLRVTTQNNNIVSGPVCLYVWVAATTDGEGILGGEKLKVKVSCTDCSVLYRVGW